MNKRFTQRILAVSALFVSATILLSSCSLLKKDSKGDSTAEDIQGVAEEFFSKLQQGKMDKALKCMADDSFDLAPIDEYENDIQDMYEAYLDTLEFEVTESEGDEDDEEGVCEVELTIADIEAIVDDLGDELTVEDVIDEISDADTISDTFEVTFIYDDEWLIDDVDDAVEFIFNPIEDIDFDIDEPIPTTTEVTVPDPTQGDLVSDWNELEDYISMEGFYNYANGYYDEDGNNPYFADSCDTIEYSIELLTDTDITLEFVLRNEIGDIIYMGSTSAYHYSDESSYWYLDCTCTYMEGLFPAGDYTMEISTSDGTVVRNVTTTVYAQ